MADQTSLKTCLVLPKVMNLVTTIVSQITVLRLLTWCTNALNIHAPSAGVPTTVKPVTAMSTDDLGASSYQLSKQYCMKFKCQIYKILCCPPHYINRKLLNDVICVSYIVALTGRVSK